MTHHNTPSTAPADWRRRPYIEQTVADWTRRVPSREPVPPRELDRLIADAPALLGDIADHLGVTTGQLRQMVSDGELRSSDVVAVMRRGAQ